MKFHAKIILIIMIICNIAALAGYYFLFQSIKNKSKAASVLAVTIDEGEQKNSRLNLLRTVIKDTETKRQQIAGYMLSGEGEIIFIEKIETLAKNSGLSAETQSVSSAGGEKGAAKTFQMQIETGGSWSNTMYFLKQVENLPYDLHIKAAALDYGSLEGKKTNGWLAEFDISVTESI